jgi:hypothetical protein
MTHRVNELKENGFKKSMVKQQARELLDKDKDRKLESNKRNKKWYAKAKNELEENHIKIKVTGKEIKS